MKLNTAILLVILITFLTNHATQAVGYKYLEAQITYTRDFLLSLKSPAPRFHPNDTSLLPPECVRGNNPKVRKRGRKGGIRERVKRQPYRQSLPSVMLGNVQSLRNKAEELRACTPNQTVCCVYCALSRHIGCCQYNSGTYS